MQNIPSVSVTKNVSHLRKWYEILYTFYISLIVPFWEMETRKKE